MNVQTLAGFGVMIWTMEEERGASVDFERLFQNIKYQHIFT